MMTSSSLSIENGRKLKGDDLTAFIIQLYIKGASSVAVYAATGVNEGRFYRALRSLGKSRYQAMRRLRIRKLRNHALALCRVASEKKGRPLNIKEITTLIPKHKRHGTSVVQLHKLLTGQANKNRVYQNRKYGILVDGKVVKVPYARYSEMAGQVQLLYTQGAGYKEIEEITGFNPDYIVRAIKYEGPARYEELRFNRKQAMLNNTVNLCLPLCKIKRRALSQEEIKALVPAGQRYGVDLKEVRDTLMEQHGFRSHALKYRRRELLDHLIELARELGRTPAFEDLRRAKKFHPSMYLKYFGGLVSAQLMAGLVPNARRRSKEVQNLPPRYKGPSFGL